MSLTGILLGLLNILLVIAVLVLFFLIVEWILSLMGIVFPPQIRKICMVILAIVALILLVGVLLGQPVVRLIGEAPVSFQPATLAGLPSGASTHL